ncbi:uncharacterized protein LOC127109618 [Lathyrus oleraceus]|uniref:uncharacterized protein LOC127109618 n=1 Tax=Pisum sativum TaxID=3888 RepID=UPI0021CF3151|nr:uncharacterized protein LOC127109618 [Pisum sativum]
MSGTRGGRGSFRLPLPPGPITVIEQRLSRKTSSANEPQQTPSITNAYRFKKKMRRIEERNMKHATMAAADGLAIKHSKDTNTMRIEELQIRLEAQELHLTERKFEQELEQALKAQTLKASSGKKNQKQEWIEERNNYGGGVKKLELSSSDKKHHNVQKGNEKFDKRKVQCYNCNKFGHFAVDDRSNKVRKGEEANIARAYYNDEPVLLMEFKNVGGSMVD